MTLLTMKDLRNGTDYEFQSLESEEYRVYVFPAGTDATVAIQIDDPVGIYIAPSGSHRVLDGEGYSHYIPTGWIQLYWKVRGDKPHFDF